VAKQTVVTLIDDLDGQVAAETIDFSIDGASYEIDLSDKNAAALRDALAPYVGVARRVGRAARPVAGRAREGRAVDLGAVREWARAQGLQVSDRGRVSAAIQDAYNAAH